MKKRCFKTHIVAFSVFKFWISGSKTSFVHQEVKHTTFSPQNAFLAVQFFSLRHLRGMRRFKSLVACILNYIVKSTWKTLSERMNLNKAWNQLKIHNKTKKMTCEILELGLKVNRHFWSELVSKVTWIREDRAMFKVNLSLKTRLHQALNLSRFQWRINWEPNLMCLRIQHIRNIPYKLKFVSIWVLIQSASSKLKRPTKNIDNRFEKKHHCEFEGFYCRSF